MLKIKKLTDYALSVLHVLCQSEQAGSSISASSIAQQLPLGLETVRKVLKMLAEAQFIQSQRGADGGYKLSCNLAQSSLKDFLTALEGKPALTSCALSDAACDLYADCSLGERWQGVNAALLQVLSEISLLTMLDSKQPLLPMRSSCSLCQDKDLL